MKTEIAVINAKEFGLEESKATSLIQGLHVPIEERKLLIEEFNKVSILEITEDNIKLFKELRLKLVKNRTQGFVKWHTASKKYFLAGGRFVDATKNKEIQINEQMESVLLNSENHFEKLEAEKLDKLHAERKKLILPFEEIDTLKDLGHMEQSMFDNLLLGVKTSHENRIAVAKKAESERIEKEKAEKLHAERKESLLPYWDYVPGENKNDDFSKLTDNEWKVRFDFSKSEKEKEEAKQLKIQKENERLKEESEAKAKRDSKRNEELRPYIIYIRKYDLTLNLEEEEYQKELSELVIAKKENEEFLRKQAEKEQKAEEEAEAKRFADKKVQQDKLKKQREESERLEKELQAKKDAEVKAEAERLANIQSELNKGDAAKVTDLICDLVSLKTKYSFKSKKNQKMYLDIHQLIDKVVSHIK